MKHLFGLATLVFVGMVAWRIGENLSSDAVGMAVGVLFGVLAGIPTAILVLAGGRRRDDDREDRPGRSMQPRQPDTPYGMQPPVIVVAGQGSVPQPGHMQQGQHWAGQAGHNQTYGNATDGWPQARQERKFKVVGETEEWIDEF